MSLRRAGILALPLLVVACTDVTQVPLPPDLVFARFSSPNIPTPNDLALAALVTRSPLVNACNTTFDACAAPPNAQAALLCSFRAAGGFPADQEVPITIPLVARRWDATVAPNGAYVEQPAAAADAASLTADTVTVVRVDGGAPVRLTFGTDFEVSTAASSGVCTGDGALRACAPATITIRKASVAGSRRWVAGARYVAAIRGGANGVTVGGLPVQADSAVALAIPRRDITKKENQPLGAVPDSSKAGECGVGSNADEITLLKGVSDALWNPVRWVNAPAGTPFPGAWAPIGDATITPAFNAVDLAFPYEETASVATFGVAPDPGTLVLVDSGSGVAPLPIDLLRTDADGTVVNNPAFGPAAAGLDTLDGFSTTAMILAQTSGPIDASTVNGANVFLYRLTKDQAGAVTAVTALRELKALIGGGGNPLTAEYVAQPTPIIVPQGAACPIAGGCSVAIGLQPAVNAGNGIRLPPLAENTSYAVVVTNRVKSVAGVGLARPSVAKILLDFTVPLTAGGASAIPGVNTATATALEKMRTELAPVLAALPAGTTRADVALAYTFKTQSITGTSLRLSAAPYSIEAGAGQAVFQVTGVTAATPPAAIPNAAGTFEITFNSLDGIDKTTGAFRPTLATDLATNPLPLLTSLKALVVTPNPANVPACGAGFPPGLSCAKVVVVGHGLGGSRDSVYQAADALTARGFIAVATDFPLHGARAWCKADAECGAGGTCTPFPGGAGQGDGAGNTPGTCTAGAPIPQISGQFFISANFFRIRDAFRQNVIDQSALVLAMARPPAPQAPQPAVDARAALGLPANVIIDPSAVRWLGNSLGALSGASVLATNPRFDRASLATGGATLVDFFTDFQSAYAPIVDGVFAGIGIPRDQIATNPTIAANYLRTLNVAKWIVDPADPANYLAHVTTAPLPNLLANPNGSVPQAAKPTFGLIAKGDPNIRNPYNELYYSLLDASTFVYQGPGGADIEHGFFGTAATAQADAAAFLFDLTLPAASPVTLP